MANTLGVYNPTFYAQEALIWLQKRLGLAGRVHLGFDAERRTYQRGDTINIRRPSTFTAQSAPSSAQDLNTDTVALSLSSWKEVKFTLTDKEMAFTGERIIQDHIMPAAYALADNIDQALAALISTVPHAQNAAGATMAIADITATRRKLFDLKVPLVDEANMHFMVGGQEEADLLALAGFTQWQGSGPQGVDAQLSGQIGRRFGFGFFANQNRSTLAFNDMTDKAGAINNAAGYAKGTTSIAVDGLDASGVYKKGTIIKITLGADLDSEYAITADATMTTGAATITINPGLRNAVADNDTFAVQAAHDNATLTENIAFHRGWAAFAMARLPDYAQLGGLGANIRSVQDPVTGLAVRSRIYYVPASSKIEIALDVLYGVKELNADLACRYELAAA